MRRVKMTGSHKGSPDGAHTYLYGDGVEYDLPNELAQVFVDNDMAVDVRQPKPKGKAK